MIELLRITEEEAKLLGTDRFVYGVFYNNQLVLDFRWLQWYILSDDFWEWLKNNEDVILAAYAQSMQVPLEILVDMFKKGVTAQKLKEKKVDRSKLIRKLKRFAADYVNANVEGELILKRGNVVLYGNFRDNFILFKTRRKYYLYFYDRWNPAKKAYAHFILLNNIKRPTRVVVKAKGKIVVGTSGDDIKSIGEMRKIFLRALERLCKSEKFCKYFDVTELKTEVLLW